MPATVDPCIAYTLTNVNFETNSASLTSAAVANVDDLAAVLVACDCPFTLHGFADPRSTSYPGGNQQLSLDRASSVRMELIARDVQPELVVDVVGHGADDPVPGDLAASRRVEIALACSGR
jgi:outer membrane protein OmpA-like peptidoglycan-associated protein